MLGLLKKKDELQEKKIDDARALRDLVEFESKLGPHGTRGARNQLAMPLQAQAGAMA
jgi:hypothetical protein